MAREARRVSGAAEKASDARIRSSVLFPLRRPEPVLPQGAALGRGEPDGTGLIDGTGVGDGAGSGVGSGPLPGG